MKRYLYFVLLFLLTITISACNNPKRLTDGRFYYGNKDLGFSLTLPSEFLYYQTQRSEYQGFIDLEIFVPTSDEGDPQEVPGYAKPIVVRIFDSDNLEEIEKADLKDFIIKSKEKGKIHAIKFWDRTPDDWREKWTEEMKQGVLDNFEVD